MRTQLICAWLLAATPHCSARAASVVSNLGNLRDGAVRVSAGYRSIASNEYFDLAAQSFTTGGSSSLLQSVTLSMADFDGGSHLNVALHGDADGVPGGSLQSLIGDADPSTAGFYEYAGTYLLAPNTTYWVLASVPQIPTTLPDVFLLPIAAFQWNYTNDLTETQSPGWSLEARHAETTGSFTTLNHWEHVDGALQMSVSAILIPEPSNRLLLGLALVITGGGVATRRARACVARWLHTLTLAWRLFVAGVGVET